MTDVNYAEFFQTMTEGPSVLLLGQDLLRQYGGEDYFLAACKSRFSLEHADTYDDLISNCSDSDDLISIWHNISDRIAVPDGLEKLAALPWNCVLTSSIHDVLDRALAADWRSVTPVLNENTFPSDPRNRIKLNLYKLFGCVTRDLDTEQPPTDDLHQLQRNSVAEAMLRQLPSLVTPKGTLFIDSLSADDWLSKKAVSEAVSQLGNGQAHLFGASAEIESVREIKLLLRLGKIVLHRVSLGAALAQLPEESYGKLVSASRTWIEGIDYSFPSGLRHTFKPAEWRRLTTGACLLTDHDANTRYQFASLDEKYRRFREFLYGTHGVPNWQAVASGLAFRRKEFFKLKDSVESVLKKQRLNEDPILVAGQSGAGKSVALADLAVTLRKAGWPVVYFGRNQTEVDSGLIETVSIELDRIESTTLLMIWDAAQSPETYASMASYLASRGRKVVVVGSTYQAKDTSSSITFPIEMSAADASKFRDYLEGFDPHLVKDVDTTDFERRNFWAWLWRLLPESRGRLRVGLLSEYEKSEQSLERSLSSRDKRSTKVSTTLGALLAEAGFETEQEDATETVQVKDAQGKDARQVERLSGLILVPASYGQDVPVDLVLRCLGREGFDVIREALRSTSVYRWVEDDFGNHALGGRQELEARAIVRSRFDRRELFDFVKLLLRNIQAQGDWREPNFEVNFAIRLLRAVGPDSTVRPPTPDELVELADVLMELTTQSGTQINPWLAFNEGFFRREALLRKKDSFDWSDPEVVKSGIEEFGLDFEKAKVALTRAESAYDPSSKDRRQRRSLSRIHNEYGALFGIAQDIQVKVRDLAADSELDRSVHTIFGVGFEEAIEHCKRSAVLDSENYYSLDVRFRVTKAELRILGEDPEVEDSRKVELVSDLCDVLDHDAWRQSTERHNTRKLELGELLNDDSIRDEALKSLAAMGSLAGEYMLAWKSMFNQNSKWNPRDQIEPALQRIEGLSEIDLRLTRLYTNGWWQCYGGFDLYDAERRVVSISREQWEHYSKWLSRRLSYADEESLKARFFYAWSLWQIGMYRESEDQFRELDRSTMAGRYRVVRLCLWSDEEGKAVSCKGTVRRISEETDKGWVYVPVLRREITFRPQDFRNQNLLPNRPLEDFHIAFNFRGPIADPARFRVQAEEA